MKRIKSWLVAPIDCSSLVSFRIGFGLIMAYASFKLYPKTLYYFHPDKFHFSYPLFSWLSPLPGELMKLFVLLMMVAALGIAIGCCYRFCASLFFLSYTYTYLLEASRYNNHYYFISIISFLLILAPAHCRFSLDARWQKELRSDSIPRWSIWSLKAQILIVYFYAGVAKINWDWLQCEPLHHWLQKRTNIPLIGPLLRDRWVTCSMSYSGLLLDLVVGFLLIPRKTRPWAMIALILFHVFNSLQFTIGVFPTLMLATMVLFLEPDTPRKIATAIRQSLFTRNKGKEQQDTPYLNHSTRSTWALWILVPHFLMQILLPLRHHLFTGDVRWTEEGHRLSWRMKLRDRQTNEFIVTVKNPNTEESFVWDPRKDLNERQLRKMIKRPDMIIQYAHHVRDQLRSSPEHSAKYSNAEIYLTVLASVNGRPEQHLIDPKVDMAKAKFKVFGHDPWILPLDSALPVGQYSDHRKPTFGVVTDRGKMIFESERQ